MEVQLWAHPACDAQIARLLAAPGAPAKAWISRTMAILDTVVERLEAEAPTDVPTEFRPRPLTRLDFDPLTLPWEDYPEGVDLRFRAMQVELALIQIGRLRSAIAVVKCPEEIFVVWLDARVTAPPRDDGFVDADDAANAQQALSAMLNRLVDLTWLEKDVP